MKHFIIECYRHIFYTINISIINIDPYYFYDSQIICIVQGHNVEAGGGGVQVVVFPIKKKGGEYQPY